MKELEVKIIQKILNSPLNERNEYTKILSLREFLKLKKAWKEEIIFESNLNNIFSNSNYINIIKIGKTALPWIIKDLKKGGGYWFVALNKITGINPIKEENRGVYEQMRKDWLEWADKNYLNERSIIITERIS